MCKCRKEDIQQYTNQVNVKVPDNIRLYNSCGIRKEEISIDQCMVNEIKAIWAEGIRTTGCCCGHNWMYGYIGVAPDDIPKMKALGYKPQANYSRGVDCTDEDSFFPKEYYVYKD